jgi:hypothetical protein
MRASMPRPRQFSGRLTDPGCRLCRPAPYHKAPKCAQARDRTRVATSGESAPGAQLATLAACRQPASDRVGDLSPREVRSANAAFGCSAGFSAGHRTPFLRPRSFATRKDGPARTSCKGRFAQVLTRSVLTAFRSACGFRLAPCTPCLSASPSSGFKAKELRT